MGIEAAVDAVLDLVAQTGLPPSAVVRTAWKHGLAGLLSEEDWVVLCQEALASRASDALHRSRRVPVRWRIDGEPADPEPIRVKVRVESVPVEHILVRIRFAGADGAIRPLAEFSREDCAALSGKARAQAAGWQQVAGWAEEAEAALAATGAPTVGKLPQPEYDRLARMAADMWGGHREE